MGDIELNGDHMFYKKSDNIQIEAQRTAGIPVVFPATI
jgi:hypothetical protein